MAGIAPAGLPFTLSTTNANAVREPGTLGKAMSPAALTLARVDRKLAFAAMVICLLGFWMLRHPFVGIAHDSILYSFQALARLHPDTLGHDIFLRFGSQDQYTIFSPLYAAAIRLFGLEPAAAILTLLSQALFFSGAWLLARRFMTAELALIAVGLLIVLPSGYGAYNIFCYVEEYLTPRQSAEALVLAGLAAALAKRHGWSLACLAGAMSLHPIMGCAGAAMLATLRFVIPKPQLALLGAGLGFIGLIGVAYLSPLGPLARMDDGWLHILQQRSIFLFILGWSATDWAKTLLPLGVLTIGALSTADTSIRSFCMAAVITAVAGTALSLVGGDLLRVVVVLQAQTWRWQWVANVAAIVLAPAICRDCWRSGTLARTAVLLLVAAFITEGQSVWLCSLLVGGALAFAIASRKGASFSHDRWIEKAARAAVVTFLVSSLAYKLQLLALDPNAFDVPMPIELQLARVWTDDGIISAAIISAAWFATRRWPGLLTSGALLILALVGCGLLFPSTSAAWTRQAYPHKLYEAYAPFRAKIPPDAEVLRPDPLIDDMDVWYLLDRRRYVSGAQTAGLVFSRAAAMAMYQRIRLARRLLGTGAFEDSLPEQEPNLTPLQRLQIACADPALGYILSWQNLGPAPLASYTPDAQRPNVQARLYRCSDLRAHP